MPRISNKNTNERKWFLVSALLLVAIAVTMVVFAGTSRQTIVTPQTIKSPTLLVRFDSTTSLINRFCSRTSFEVKFMNNEELLSATLTKTGANGSFFFNGNQALLTTSASSSNMIMRPDTLIVTFPIKKIDQISYVEIPSDIAYSLFKK
jgi:hypothetical protein